MKFILLAVLALTALAYAEDDVDQMSTEELTAYGYLERFGVPEGERIRKAEEEFIRRSRIVGGVPAGAGLIIDIQGIDGRGVCGGSLISTTRVSTAAHCWFDGRNQAWRFTVVLGSTFLFSGGTRIETSAIATHPNWSPSLIRNDVAVIYLPSAVPQTNLISPIALPSGAELFEDFAGSSAIASGFGLTQDGGGIGANQQLSHVRLNVITNSACSIAFPFVLQGSNICTSGVGGVGTCNGDSGGPLVVNRNNRNIMIGVTSFGSAFGCSSGLPAAYARVTSFVDFFLQHL